jgi:predicted alpha/beta superfamily hydrolase
MIEQSVVVEREKVTLRATEQPAEATGTWTRISVVYLHVFEGDGADVWQRLGEGGRPAGLPAMALVAIAPRSWDNDLTPWPSPPVFRGGRAFEGAAAAQLDLLEREIMPQAEALLAQHGMVPSFSALAGYSLAGLFAAWAATQSGAFERVASISGSLWYPDFVKYVAGNRPRPAVQRAYFSLGDAEPHTRNRAMRSVLEDTQRVAKSFEQAGVVTRFELNPGNHFVDEDLRTARGIAGC